MSQISYSINRSRNGIIFTVETVPQIEDFFATDHTQNGEITDVCLFGRLWGPTSNGDLKVYPIPPTLAGPILTGNPREIIRVDRPGLALLDDPQLGGPTVNLSVLRLVGVSQPGGISFKYDGVFTVDALKVMLRRYQDASAAFYASLLTPVKLSGRIMKED